MEQEPQLVMGSGDAKPSVGRHRFYCWSNPTKNCKFARLNDVSGDWIARILISLALGSFLVT